MSTIRFHLLDSYKFASWLTSNEGDTSNAPSSPESLASKGNGNNGDKPISLVTDAATRIFKMPTPPNSSNSSGASQYYVIIRMEGNIDKLGAPIVAENNFELDATSARQRQRLALLVIPTRLSRPVLAIIEPDRGIHVRMRIPNMTSGQALDLPSSIFVIAPLATDTAPRTAAVIGSVAANTAVTYVSGVGTFTGNSVDNLRVALVFIDTASIFPSAVAVAVLLTAAYSVPPAVAPRAIAPRVIPRRAIPRRAIPRRAIAPRTVAPCAVAPCSVALRVIASRDIASRIIASCAIASRTATSRAVARRTAAAVRAARVAAAAAAPIPISAVTPAVTSVKVSMKKAAAQYRNHDDDDDDNEIAPSLWSRTARCL
ncbi:hypothetical protein BG004_008174 [Podila humilis]|nr:hypothetical protein BG004_008174 [Podila humilis]